MSSTCRTADASCTRRLRIQRRRLLAAWLAAPLGAAGGPLHAQPAARPTGVVVVSDPNGSHGSTRHSAEVDAAARHTIALAPGLVISTGDMVAGQRLNPPRARDAIQARWQAFDRHVTTALERAGLPFAVTPGNHDASSGARFAQERELYCAQWLPRRPALDFVDPSACPFDYAFRVRDALFVSLDATHVGHLSAASKRRLEQLLAQHGPN